MISRNVRWAYRVLAAALSVFLAIPSPAYAARIAGVNASGVPGAQKARAELREDLEKLGHGVETKFVANRAEVRSDAESTSETWKQLLDQLLTPDEVFTIESLLGHSDIAKNEKIEIMAGFLRYLIHQTGEVLDEIRRRIPDLNEQIKKLSLTPLSQKDRARLVRQRILGIGTGMSYDELEKAWMERYYIPAMDNFDPPENKVLPHFALASEIPDIVQRWRQIPGEGNLSAQRKVAIYFYNKPFNDQLPYNGFDVSKAQLIASAKAETITTDFMEPLIDKLPVQKRYTIHRYYFLKSGKYVAMIVIGFPSQEDINRFTRRSEVRSDKKERVDGKQPPQLTPQPISIAKIAYVHLTPATAKRLFGAILDVLESATLFSPRAINATSLRLTREDATKGVFSMEMWREGNEALKKSIMETVRNSFFQQNGGQLFEHVIDINVIMGVTPDLKGVILRDGGEYFLVGGQRAGIELISADRLVVSALTPILSTGELDDKIHGFSPMIKENFTFETKYHQLLVGFKQSASLQPLTFKSVVGLTTSERFPDYILVARRDPEDLQIHYYQITRGGKMEPLINGVILYDEIDKRIQEYPKETRPHISFKTDDLHRRDGFLQVWHDSEFWFYDAVISDFVVEDGALFVKTLQEANIRLVSYYKCEADKTMASLSLDELEQQYPLVASKFSSRSEVRFASEGNFVLPVLASTKALRTLSATSPMHPADSGFVLQVEGVATQKMSDLLTVVGASAASSVKVVIARAELRKAVERFNAMLPQNARPFLIARNAEEAFRMAQGQISDLQLSGVYSSRAELRALVLNPTSSDAVKLRELVKSVVNVTDFMLRTMTDASGITNEIMNRVRAELRMATAA